jgi:phosphoesterase RecJ-like protein
LSVTSYDDEENYTRIIKPHEYTIVEVERDDEVIDAICDRGIIFQRIKDNFKDKKVYTVGNDFKEFTPKLFPFNDEVNELKNHLAIVLDTANEARIDNKSYKEASYIIKFDHHPGNDNYGNINIVNTELASCSELIVNFVSYFKKYQLSKEASKYLYIGIVGDSQRFMTSSTSSYTLEAGIKCIESELNINEDVYLPMYEKSINDFDIQKYLLNNYKISEHGVCYYVLSNEELNKIGIKMEQTKKFLSTFANIKEINIWCSISEDPEGGIYWVSIRSKRTKISDVARKYQGGGHDLASGCKLNSIEELDSFINDLDNLLK